MRYRIFQNVLQTDLAIVLYIRTHQNWVFTVRAYWLTFGIGNAFGGLCPRDMGQVLPL